MSSEMNQINHMLSTMDMVNEVLFKPKKEPSSDYFKGLNVGKGVSKKEVAQLEKKIRELKRLVDCKHMRVGSYRIDNGFNCKCLTCGDEWETKDKPLSEFDKFMKAGMERELKKSGVRTN